MDGHISFDREVDMDELILPLARLVVLQHYSAVVMVGERGVGDVFLPHTEREQTNRNPEIGFEGWLGWEK